MQYYKVLAKCGHARRSMYILKWFYIKAESRKDAAAKIRMTGRVKHHQKDAIREVIPISFNEYITGKKLMASDMYFHVHNSSDQRLFNCIKPEELYPEEGKEKKAKYEKSKQRKIFEIKVRESVKMIQCGEYE